MKILLLNDYTLPLGGAELGTLMLRDGLREQGHDARIFGARTGTDPGFADYHCYGSVGRGRTLLQAFNPSAYWQLRSVLKRFQPDIVHVRLFLTQLSPLILPLLRGYRCLLHAVWLRPVCPLATKVLPDGSACHYPWGGACLGQGCLPIRDFAPLMFQRLLWRRWRGVFHRVVANSQAVRQALLEDGIEAVEVIWNGVPLRPQRPRLSGPPSVAFAGRLVPQKGCDLLIEAVARLGPEVRLVIAGEGPERAGLEARVSRLGLGSRTTFTGHLDSERLEAVLGQAWVQCVPSRYAEGFGYVAAEAMMRGTAVVASACGGLEELARAAPGARLVKPGDVDSLVESLAPLLTEPEFAEACGQQNRTFALHQLSRAAYLRRFLDLYGRLLGQECCQDQSN